MSNNLEMNDKNRNLNYQDVLLNILRKDKVPVTIFLTSGFQIKCTIKAFDVYVVMVETDGKLQMIFKHAISTVAPQENITINYLTGERER